MKNLVRLFAFVDEQRLSNRFERAGETEHNKEQRARGPRVGAAPATIKTANRSKVHYHSVTFVPRETRLTVSRSEREPDCARLPGSAAPDESAFDCCTDRPPITETHHRPATGLASGEQRHSTQLSGAHYLSRPDISPIGNKITPTPRTVVHTVGDASADGQYYTTRVGGRTHSATTTDREVVDEDDWILIDEQTAAQPIEYPERCNRQEQPLNSTRSLTLFEGIRRLVATQRKQSQPQMALDKADIELINASWDPARTDPVGSGVLLFKG